MTFNDHKDIRTGISDTAWVAATLLGLCLLCFSATSSAGRVSNFKPDTPPTEADLGLRDALSSNDIGKFYHYLSTGGDPTRWFGNGMHGWVFCGATEAGKEEFLQLIIDTGSDVNYRQTNISSRLSLPLLCAIAFNNRPAIELLIVAGADPTKTVCVECDTKHVSTSALFEAVIISRFEDAIWLLDKGDYSNTQLQSVIKLIEDYPIPETFPGYAPRLKLAELLRQRGFEVNP